MSNTVSIIKLNLVLNEIINCKATDVILNMNFRLNEEKKKENTITLSSRNGGSLLTSSTTASASACGTLNNIYSNKYTSN